MHYAKHNFPEIMLLVLGTNCNKIGCIGTIIPIWQTGRCYAVFIPEFFCHDYRVQIMQGRKLCSGACQLVRSCGCRVYFKMSSDSLFNLIISSYSYKIVNLVYSFCTTYLVSNSILKLHYFSPFCIIQAEIFFNGMRG